MAFQVDIILKEIIKPSSSTPNHLNIYKLSLLDQTMATINVPLVLFYSSTSNDNMVEHLMRSLSKTLTQFYPLAGRIDGNDFITCNDEGVDFFKTRVNVQLSQLLINPKYEDLMELVPITDKFYGLGSKVLLSIQANIFDCGGIAIGVRISHALADASTISLFLNSWAAHAKAEGNINEITAPQPIFDMTPYFPPKEGTPIYIPGYAPAKKMIITKRFVFDECTIAALKVKCSNSSYIENPSRVESIIALLWKCGMDAARKKGDDDMIQQMKSVATVAVDLRRRMNPPLSNLCVGSLVFTAVVAASSSSTIESSSNPELVLQSLVSQVRKKIKTFDSNYLRKIQYEDEYIKNLHSLNEAEELHAKKKQFLIIFSSWCSFPFYEIDFGWGKPAWISPLFQGGNVIILLDTKCGKGVETWVTLDEEDMDIFEHQLISFISNLNN